MLWAIAWGVVGYGNVGGKYSIKNTRKLLSLSLIEKIIRILVLVQVIGTILRELVPVLLYPEHRSSYSRHTQAGSYYNIIITFCRK